MSYTVDVDPAAQATIDVLPPELLDLLVEVFSVLALAPSINPERNPDGAVRTIAVTTSVVVVYLVLEREQRVDVLRIVWAG